MPRRPRRVIPGVPLHIIQRGVDRVRTFHAEADYAHYSAILGEASRVVGIAIHAYVLMPNHVHILLTPPQASAPANLMMRLGARYVRYVNTVYGRTGTLWEGRFRSALVDSDRYLLACMRYIELNPVRAGLASNPESYRWSSFRHHADGQPDALLSPHALYLKLGRSPRGRREAYRALCQQALGPDTLHAIRSASRAQRSRVSSREGTEFETFASDGPRGLGRAFATGIGPGPGLWP